MAKSELSLFETCFAKMLGRAAGYWARGHQPSRDAWVEEMIAMRALHGSGDTFEQNATASFVSTLHARDRVIVQERLTDALNGYENRPVGLVRIVKYELAESVDGLEKA